MMEELRLIEAEVQADGRGLTGGQQLVLARHLNSILQRTIRGQQNAIGAWQVETFGPGGAELSMPLFKHLEEEVRELMLELSVAGYKPTPAIAEEMADVAIIILAMAARMGLNLEAEVEAKMAKNRKRKWLPPDNDGVIRHERAP